MFNILVVEDDAKLRRLFCTVLEQNGYHAIPAEDGLQALDLLEQHYVDLIVSDLMMPHMDGFELSQQLREAHFQMPILIITAKEQFQDMRAAFKTGVDDYMVKPINVKEMVLRVEALLRRAQVIHERRVIVGSTTLLYDALTVQTDTDTLLLPQKEFLLIYKLLSFPGKIFTRQQLMDEIWGLDNDSDIRTVDVHINRLRERFCDNPDFKITTVRGLGYKAEKQHV